MSTSRFAFMTPTRLSDQEHPHIRAFVHNLRTDIFAWYNECVGSNVDNDKVRGHCNQMVNK